MNDAITLQTVLCFEAYNAYGLNPGDKSRFDYDTRRMGILTASDTANLSASDCEHLEESGHHALADVIFEILHKDFNK